jgi:hypothetical protein
MKKFMERLPIYNGKFTKEIVSITFNHFMDGQKMYLVDGKEITTQAGFKYAVLTETNLTEKQIDEIIERHNARYVTPDEYRKLKMELKQYHTADFKQNYMAEYKKKHPVKYILAMIKVTRNRAVMAVEGMIKGGK